ncbi:hypothetical protein [Anabaenopsis elenkinii]|uniref:Uncharacterized protein n=1 Tax=Anabaenopsis elenkinii CCIBt3563 TaxID=2779889 RepID=A0A7S6RF20_9CYAN|nr:hypothetical protein [Anabaenopsis elenkinii]QOV23719.1 hypothetical protein IM676_05365 [Anabaenopsis elenkinii CCIBt3563]
MSKHLIIKDLDYLQEIGASSPVTGGNVHVSTGTTVNSGYAGAFAVALAEGEHTFTDTQTLARVILSGNFSMSLARARAIAFASTGNRIYQSVSNQTTMSFHFFNSTSF